MTIQATFDRLEGCLELAQQIVPVTDVVRLVELLPIVSVESQRFILAELLKLDMAAAADLGQIRLLDFYLPACQKWLSENDIPLDLVLEELQVRRDSGQNPTLAEYQGRFPRWAAALADFPWEQINTRRTNSTSGLPDLETGQYIDDFRVLRPLGRGAFAQVYLAIQESMNRLVALKISSRGTDEPQTLSQLDHPNIVRVFDQRKLNQQQVHLLYMQAVLGGTLANVVNTTRERPLKELTGAILLQIIDQALVSAQQQPPDRTEQWHLSKMDWATTVAWLGQQLAEGLHSAHAQGVFHRDVKPANILLSAEGKPKLADFNVSHSGFSERGSAVGGTLAYMSPEHLRATDVTQPQMEPVDERSDLYSLAVVLWELWQGQRPWPNAAPANTWSKAVQEQLDLRNIGPNNRREDKCSAGQWLNRVLRQSLQSDPKLRPQTGNELSMRLRLTMYPALATRFAPSSGSIVDRLRKAWVFWVATLICIVPNGLAGLLNYTYNNLVIISKYRADELPLLPQVKSTTDSEVEQAEVRLSRDQANRMQQDFDKIAWWVNGIAFSLGAVILAYFCRRIRNSLQRAKENLPASPKEIDWIWKFGHRAAMIGAGLWLSFGLIFPIAIQWYQPLFRGSDFTHFFMSLAICGGMAWIYPYYGVSLLSVVVYYPHVISPTMSDPGFIERATWMRRRADFYLASSAVIPLLSLFLIIGRAETEVPNFLKLILVGLTLLSVVFSFKAYQILARNIDQLDKVLGTGSLQTAEAK